MLLSGLLKRGGAADRLRLAWEEGSFVLVTSEWQIGELRRVSRYPKLTRHLRPHEVGRLVGHMRRRAVVVASLPNIEASPDPDDDPILATAVGGSAERIVTGDKSHLIVLRTVGGIQILSATEFARELGVHEAS